MKLQPPPSGKPKGKARHSQVTFKPYQQDQMLLLPPSLEELVAPNHLARVISRAIDQMNLQPLLQSYKGGGTSSYHPRMMLKVLIYAYTQKRFTSRQIAKALREDVVFMWLSGNNRPDFRTINHFRSSRLKESIDSIFASLVAWLHEQGYINLEQYFQDGTKMEANANKYSYVWRKSVRRYKKRLKEKIQGLLAHIDEVNEKENAYYGTKDLAELGEQASLSSEKLSEIVAELDKELAQRPEDKKLKRTVKTLKKELPRLARYEQQEQIMAGRNSYSKTDPDATFMRMKDDPLNQGQLKPAYNIQAGTENQFVVGVSVHQNAADSACFIEHLDKLEAQHGRLPNKVIADAGYGCEENYEYLQRKAITGFVKYGSFHREQNKKFQENRFHTQNLAYDEARDEFICPAGKPMRYEKTVEVTTATGYKLQKRIYKAEGCAGCELRRHCYQGNGDRRIHINFRLRHFQQRARDRLLSEQGKRLRFRRGVEVESVFGNIKRNLGFRRFWLRGLQKVNIEINLLCLAHNMIKMAA
ncbi:IS1182 family transposase [Candidatus Parcubacteria bacterium]|nr:MAG: IS1182 family transposase [Candidatus Parcubacteria bacterium]